MSGLVRKPVIAVTAWIEEDSTQLKRDNTESVVRAGGIPLIVPYLGEEADVRRICELTDGLLITGGKDIDPSLYGEDPLPGLGALSPDRDRVELMLTQAFLEADKPIFAICRGHQMLNVAAGGTLFQDIGSQCDDVLQHRQEAPRSHLHHRVSVASGTLLERVMGAGEFKVNSFHHQAVNIVAPDFCACAWAPDGIVEGIESKRHRYVLGVQWHPENTAASDIFSRKLFDSFIEAVRHTCENT
jgi:putative glutamine amidotransferase